LIHSLVFKLLVLVQNRHQQVWDCSGSRGICDDCNGWQSFQSGFSSHPVESNFPAGCGSWGVDASAQGLTVTGLPGLAYGDRQLQW